MRGFASVTRELAVIALPPRCPGCGSVVRGDHRFCGDCWQSLEFLGEPWCAGCALPFAVDRGPGARCAACLRDPPVHAGIRAAVAYGPVARTVALRLKYGGRLAFAQTMARLMARHLPPGADLLVPVPLHRWRLWSRGFNQAALIADALSSATGIASNPLVLTRRRRTPPLRGMNPGQRRKAVRGAFAVHSRHGDAVARRHVVLVDDIHTSGATAQACTRVLLAAGAARVTIVCWARVIGETPD
ncbi:double zinc ribbon domain-containing protein [uncultured Sphingomonas sp.]|uniref:double zinc ribbon domain-containing protein n=1 Tax=uncultured Sphingomonas sp. TaxID=158754 RepID=UPI0035CC4E40